MQKPVLRGNTREYRALALFAFLLPVCIMLAAYAAIGVFPFGDKSLLLVDMNSEYIDYYAHLSRTVRKGGSFLRAWEMGMGLNMVGLVAFYTASPLNLLLLAAPGAWLTEAVLLLTLLKFGLCGLFFHCYAGYTFGDSVGRWGRLAASVAYALCGYNLAYSSNLMWLDGVFMLPLVCLGIERLLREGKHGFLTVSMVYLFLSGYYVGYMVGVFSLMYFTISCISEKYSFKAYADALLRFLLSAATAAGCCAFLLLPAFLELRHGQVELWDVPISWSLDISLSSLAAKLLPGAYDSLTDRALPHLYTTVAAVVGATLFFTAKGPSRREKLCWGGLLGILLLSLACDVINLAWHAFEVPTWFPARYSFVFSFLLLHLALRGMGRREEVSRGAAAAAAGIPLLLFVEAGIQRYDFLQTGLVLGGALLAVAYGCGVLLWTMGARRRRSGAALAVCLVLFVCGEAAGNAVAMVKGMDEEFQYRSRSRYYGFRQEYQPAVDWVGRQQEPPARIEILQQRNANGGLTLGYKGISHYSTTTDQNLNTLLKSLGYNTGTINELRFARSTPVTNGLLGIRYVLSTEGMGEGYQLQHQTGGVGIYRNSLGFPLAFFTGGDVLDKQWETDDPFMWQNQVITALTEEAAVFLPLSVEDELLENMAFSETDSFLQYKRINTAGAGVVELTAYNPTGGPAYAFLPVWERRYAKATATADGREAQKELAYRNNTILSLGAGERPALRVEVTDGQMRLRGMYFYALDLDAANRAAAAANRNAMTFSTFEDTLVEGTVTAPVAGALVTTFPHDPGWKIFVDGQPVELRQFAGAFLAAELPSGVHHVTMRYRPPGFAAGCAVTGTVLALWAIGAWIRLRKRQG